MPKPLSRHQIAALRRKAEDEAAQMVRDGLVYLVLEIHPDPVETVAEPPGYLGFCEVFDSLEAAQEAYPGAQVEMFSRKQLKGMD